MLRRSLGVSLTAKANVEIKPAPPTAHGPLSESGVGEDEANDDSAFIQQAMGGGFGGDFGGAAAGEGEEWLDWKDLKQKNQPAEETVIDHDEL